MSAVPLSLPYLKITQKIRCAIEFPRRADQLSGSASINLNLLYRHL